MPATFLVEIPADVRDNSATVTDYAFMRHLSPDRGVRTPSGRDYELKVVREHLGHMYEVFAWSDVNPDGQRCRFDMVVRKDSGTVAYLFHTEYFTRTACAEGHYCHSYASVYQVIATGDAEPGPAVPRCDEHAGWFRRACTGEPGLVLMESERLLIGQHD
jgi:hypothetical protein